MHPELARKLQDARRRSEGIAAADEIGSFWEDQPKASSADKRGEWLLVDAAAITQRVSACSSDEEPSATANAVDPFAVFLSEEPSAPVAAVDPFAVFLSEERCSSVEHSSVPAPADVPRDPSPRQEENITSEFDLEALQQQLRLLSREEGRSLLRSLPTATRQALASQVAASGSRATLAVPQPAENASEPPASRAVDLASGAAMPVLRLGEAPESERERIQRDRAAWAADCARRWPAVLLASSDKPLAKPNLGEDEEAGDAMISDADARVIRADVARTRSSDPHFQAPEVRTQLTSMLTDFCEREGVRYLQGLNEVAAAFVFVEGSATADSAFDEAQALACLRVTVRRFMPYFHDGDAFVALHISLLFFRQLILYHHPDLHNFLAEAGISPMLYAMPWFITLFAARTPLSVLLRLWDRYFARGDASFLPFLAVATLAAEKATLLATGTETCDTHSAIMKVGIKTLERLDAVWDAADLLQKQTPQSFSLRMSRMLAAVLEKRGLPKSAEGSWSERVLDRVAKERRFSVLPGEIAIHAAPRPSGPHTAASVNSMAGGSNANPCHDAIEPDAEPETSSGACTPAEDTQQKLPMSSASSVGLQAIASSAPSLSSSRPRPRRASEASAQRRLRLILLDVRSQEEFESEHLPKAVHFNPPCLRHLKASVGQSGSQFHIDRLAAALKEAVGNSIGSLLAGKAPASAVPVAMPKAGAGSVSAPGGPDTALLQDVFTALHAVIMPRWGEAWLSDLTCVHIVLLGGALDSSESADNTMDGNVAPLYEALTEHLALPRVSVAQGGASAVHREAVKRGVQLSRGMVPPDTAGALLGSAALLGSNAWSRLREASEALPAVDGVGAQLEGLFRSGAEVARSSAQVAARGIAEGVTAVTQQAVESAAVVRRQSVSASKESDMGTGVTCSTVGSELSSELSEDSELSSPSRTPREVPVREDLGRSMRTWVCDVSLPTSCEEPVAWPDRPAVLCLGADGRVLVCSKRVGTLTSFDQIRRPETEVMGSFSARSLWRIGTSPATPRTLSFYFASSTDEMPRTGGASASARPALVALFESAELARACARALATPAAAARRQRAVAEGENRPQGQLVRTLQSAPKPAHALNPMSDFDPLAFQDANTRQTINHIASPNLPDLWARSLPDPCVQTEERALGAQSDAAPSSANDGLRAIDSFAASPITSFAAWDDAEGFLLELEQLKGLADTPSGASKDSTTAAQTGTPGCKASSDYDAFFRELDELAGLG